MNFLNLDPSLGLVPRLSKWAAEREGSVLNVSYLESKYCLDICSSGCSLAFRTTGLRRFWGFKTAQRRGRFRVKGLGSCSGSQQAQFHKCPMGPQVMQRSE